MEDALKLEDLRLGRVGPSGKCQVRESAVLQRTKSGITLTVAWEGRRPSWLSGKPIEPTLTFVDTRGSVVLLGCRMGRLKVLPLGKQGTANISAERAILGAPDSGDYAEINAVRSRISGLRSWSGITSWEQTVTYGEGTFTASLSAKRTQAEHLGQRDTISLDLNPSWRMEAITHQENVGVNDIVWCETAARQPKPWVDHMLQHRALRDLVVLSRWNRESCIPAQARRDDQTTESLSGEEHPAEWLPVTEGREEASETPARVKEHLMPYKELGEAGVRDWVELRETRSRAFDPLVTSIELQDTARPITLLAHTGPGLEALGYYVKIEGGLSKKKASCVSLKDRIEAILEEANDCLPFDTTAWAKTTAEVYNGIKHANRSEPSQLEVLDAWRGTVFVMRAWLAIRLGIDQADVKSRLNQEWERAQYAFV